MSDDTFGLVPASVRERYLHRFAAVSFVIILAVSLVLVGFLASLQETRKADVESRIETDARSHASDTLGWMQSREGDARFASRLVGFADGEGMTDQRLESILVQLPPEVREIHYLDLSTGEVLGSTAGEGSPLRARGPWRENDDFSQSTAVRVTSPYAVGDTAYLAFVSPVVDPDDRYGESGRAVVLVVDIAAGLSFEESVPGSHTQVVDAEGRPVAGYQPAAGPLVPAADLDGLGRTAGSVSVDGSVVGYAPVSGTDMTVVTVAPPSTYSVVETGTLLYAVAVVVMIALGLAVVGWAHERPAARAIEGLAEKAERMEAGDLDVPLDTDRDDEIGDLYRSFANMRDSLRDSLADARQAREQAEQRRAEAERAQGVVEERNEQIEFFNDVLRHHVLNGAMVIDGNVDALADHVDEAGRDRLETIRAWNDDIAELTRRVRRVIEAVSTERTPAADRERDLSTALWEAVTAAGTDDVTVEADIDDDLRVYGGDLFEEVLRSAVENAVERSGPGEGTVSVGTRRAGDRVRVRIANDGPEPSEEVKERAFDRDVTSGPGGSAGFGLYFVRVMVEQYGGDLRFEDDDGRTVVVLSFRRATAATERVEPGNRG